jgi:single-stranded DNA-specific DHH superfamily exonuclease
MKKWGSPIITGDAVSDKPKMIGFKHYEKGIDMLKHHISNQSNIAVHCDVDGDGIGCGYIFDRFLTYNGVPKARKTFLINREKVHGITQAYVNYLNATNNKLLVILDSSCNELEHIKNMKFDVLVVDHHELIHEDLEGETAGGRYVIITNMISNHNLAEDWLAWKGFDKNRLETWSDDENMSCGLVLYEFLRLYCYFDGQERLLENAKLYQWVAFTLFTDAISMLNKRNQWYMDQSIYSQDVEPTMKVMITTLNKYKTKLDKTLINFTLAPLINKGIRAGHSQEVLEIVLSRPHAINELAKYKENQEYAISFVYSDIVYRDKFAMRDITSTGISSSYCGVMAIKLQSSSEKSSAVYIVDNGVAKGSFRGKVSSYNYRAAFAAQHPDIYAQGHSTAFGFKVPLADLEQIMTNVMADEPEIMETLFLTAGVMPIEWRGENHIENIQQFQRDGDLLRMAIGNSKVAAREAIKIVCSQDEVTLDSVRGKLMNYRCLGLPCKAFSELNHKLVALYPEFIDGRIEIYAENIA